MIFLGPLNQNLKTKLEEIVCEFGDLHMIESTHISLSKTFVLKYHWIDNFFTSLRKKFEKCSMEFLLQFADNLAYFSNEEKSRYFGCILASECSITCLSSITEKVDFCLKEFDLPLYYENPSFHMSLIWKLSEFTSQEKTYIASKLKELMDSPNELLSLKVDKISCKSGNKLIEIPI